MSDWKIIQPQTSDITNLCTNPSFEINTTGWVQGTNWTLSRDATYAFRGIYSGKLLAGAGPATIMVTYAATLTASETYHITGWIYVDTWNGGNIYLASAGFTSATPTYNSFYIDGTSPKGAWIYLETKLVLDADNIGNITLFTSSAASASDVVYFDLITLTQTTSGIIPFDGDTDGCYWTGAEHGSTSTAPAYIRNVGVETDLDDDLSFRVRQMLGAGMPQSRHITDESTFGAIFRSTKTQPRVLSLTGAIKGTSLANYHSKRKDILDIIYPNANEEEYYFRYYGANSDIPVELKCVYDTGFDLSTISADLEMINWRSIAHDPFWYELPQEKATLTTRGTATFAYIAAKIQGDWTDISSTFNGDVLALAYDKQNDILYAGGDFTAPSNYIAKYQNGSWSALSSGLDGIVRAIAIDSIGDVYIGGNFTDVSGGGGGTYNYIIKWDLSGSSWSALGTGMNAYVDDIAIDSTGKVYVCGGFTTGNGVTLNLVGYWNGSTFVAMGTTGLTGGNLYAQAMAIDAVDNVYIGGDFDTAGGAALTSDGICKWDGSTYTSLGTHTGTKPVYRIIVASDGTVYAAGAFGNMGDITTADGIAAWSGSGWYGMGDGLSTPVWAIAEFDGQIWAGNVPPSVVWSGADRLTLWDGSGWQPTDIDLPGTPIIHTMIVLDRAYYQDIYLGFDQTGSGTYGIDTTVTNNGSANSYPVLTLWNEGATNTEINFIRNETTRSTIWMDYNIQPSEKLVIDFNPFNFSITSNFNRLTAGAIRGGSNIDFYLQPGDNIITIFTPEASITAGLTWRNAHWSVDGVAA